MQVSHLPLKLMIVLAIPCVSVHAAAPAVLDIGDRLELFVDNHLVESTDNVTHQLHHPVPRETALTFDKPWEGRYCGYFTVEDGDCSDTVFMSSRGGSVYDRTFMEGFIRPGVGLNNWTSRIVTWGSSTSLARLAGEPVKIRFKMKDADVYSIRVMGATGAAAEVGESNPVPQSPDPQRQADLPRMLAFEWSAGQPMPQGMQDNHVTLIHNWLVSVGGFCGGGDDDWKQGKYPRGFLNKTWGLDLNNVAAGWVDLPAYPGAPRQGAQGARVGNALYVWGGFSYSEPYTYRDGYRLSRGDSDWRWTPLPPLPSPSSWAGISAMGPRIYAVGGADYDAQRFYTLTDRTGKHTRLGARLIVFDTEQPGDGWTERALCPGTPRCLTTAAVIDGTIYVMGGVGVMKSGTYCNVVDCWRYDPKADTWERLRDMPISGTGSSSSLVVYKERYIVLPCGYQYGEIMKPDGCIAPMYGTPSKVKRTWKNHPRYKTTHYYNHCYVYDTKTNLYGTATALPFDDVATITVIESDTAYMFPGETGGFVWAGEYFGHHPEFVLKGSVKELAWE